MWNWSRSVWVIRTIIIIDVIIIVIVIIAIAIVIDNNDDNQVKDVRVPEQLQRAMAAEAEAAREARAKVPIFGLWPAWIILLHIKSILACFSGDSSRR